MQQKLEYNKPLACTLWQVFFCEYNDPIYVKMEKLEIMIKLANEKNIDQVLPMDCASEQQGWRCPSTLCERMYVEHSWTQGLAQNLFPQQHAEGCCNTFLLEIPAELFPGIHMHKLCLAGSGAAGVQGVCHRGGCRLCAEGSACHRPLRCVD